MADSKDTPYTARRSRRWMKWLFAFLFVALAIDVGAGVLVAPTVAFLSDKSRTGRLTIQNPSDQPKEVTIRFSFGLPQSDSLGNVYVNLQDSGVTDPRSALGWIQAFPRKFILPPRGSQIVRLVARPPENLVDGEYWARIVIRSKEGQTTVPAASDDEGIHTRLNMIMETAIMVKYRTGSLVSNLELADASVQTTDNRVVLLADFINRGNVSYMGRMSTRLLDQDNNVVGHSEVDVAVYRSLKRRVELALPETSARGPYRLEMEISTDGRTDVAPEDVVSGNRIEYSSVIDE